MALQRFNPNYVPNSVSRNTCIYKNFDSKNLQTPPKDDEEPSGFIDEKDDDDHEGELDLHDLED